MSKANLKQVHYHNLRNFYTVIKMNVRYNKNNNTIYLKCNMNKM